MVGSRRRLFFEPLEARSLLSGLSYSLTTDQSTYQVGQTIEITLTETNRSNQPLTVEVTPTDFTISQGGYSIWQSNSSNANQPPTAETLQPGQSLTQTAAWDGTTPYSLSGSPNGDPLSWSLNNWGTFVVSNPNAPPDVTATFQITDSISSSLTTNQSLYQIGQPIQATFTQTNTSDQTLTFLPQGPSSFSISPFGTSIVVNNLPVSVSLNPVTWAPGKTVTVTQTWNGIPQTGQDNPANTTGAFVVGYGPQGDPQEFKAVIQVTPASPTSPPSPTGAITSSGTTTAATASDPAKPLVDATLSTNHRAYRPGQSVRITLTIHEPVTGQKAASHGTTAATPNPKLDRITVLEGSTVVWQSRPGVFTREARKLRPGRPINLSAVWNGRPNQPGMIKLTPGTYTIKAEGDGDTTNTTITIEPGRTKANG